MVHYDYSKTRNWIIYFFPRPLSPNSLSLSVNFNPRANRILRYISIRYGFPCSMREIVIGDTPAFLASSDWLNMRDSLICLREFGFVMFTLYDKYIHHYLTI